MDTESQPVFDVGYKAAGTDMEVLTQLENKLLKLHLTLEDTVHLNLTDYLLKKWNILHFLV